MNRHAGGVASLGALILLCAALVVLMRGAVPVDVAQGIWLDGPNATGAADSTDRPSVVSMNPAAPGELHLADLPRPADAKSTDAGYRAQGIVKLAGRNGTAPAVPRQWNF